MGHALRAARTPRPAAAGPSPPVRGAGDSGRPVEPRRGAALVARTGCTAGPEPQHRDLGLPAVDGRRLPRSAAPQRCVRGTERAPALGGASRTAGRRERLVRPAARLAVARAALAGGPADACQARAAARLPIPLRLRHLRPAAVSDRRLPRMLCAQPGAFTAAALDARLRDRRRARPDRADPHPVAAQARRVRAQGRDHRHGRRAACLLPAGRGPVRRIEARRPGRARPPACAQQLRIAQPEMGGSGSRRRRPGR